MRRDVGGYNKANDVNIDFLESVILSLRYKRTKNPLIKLIYKRILRL